MAVGHRPAAGLAVRRRALARPPGTAQPKAAARARRGAARPPLGSGLLIPGAARTARTALAAVALAAVALATALAGGRARAAPACEVEGERVQWAADVCMLQLQTDDEIAASDCLAAEGKRRFADDCVAKRHYKRRLCALSIGHGLRAGELAACVADPAFKGRTVASGGVGA